MKPKDHTDQMRKLICIRHPIPLDIKGRNNFPKVQQNEPVTFRVAPRNVSSLQPSESQLAMGQPLTVPEVPEGKRNIQF